MLIDVDQVPSNGLAASLAAGGAPLAEALLSSRIAVVVPAFEPTTDTADAAAVARRKHQRGIVDARKGFGRLNQIDQRKTLNDELQKKRERKGLFHFEYVLVPVVGACCNY